MFLGMHDSLEIKDNLHKVGYFRTKMYLEVTRVLHQWQTSKLFEESKKKKI